MSTIRLTALSEGMLAAVDRALGGDGITWITDDGGNPVAAVVPVSVADLIREMHRDARFARGLALADRPTTELPAVRP